MSEATDYEVQQRMAKLAPAGVASAERWAHHMIQQIQRSGMVVRLSDEFGAGGRCFCARCERAHAYCECDEFAHLGTHSAHGGFVRGSVLGHPHPMGE